MIMTTLWRLPLRFAVPLALAVLTAACVSYTPSELGRLSGLELCELRADQGIHLTDETKSALQNELQRRNDDCRTYAATLAQRRADTLYRDVYGKHDDP
jgi:hypothetical protein